MAYYVDFVGLNTFIYEPVGWSGVISETKQIHSGPPGVYTLQNTLGVFDDDGNIRVLPTYKNFLFSHNLPTTASFFPALMLKRNGPYGFPTWKQIRIGQNPLTRRQNKENVFTFVEEPGPEIVIDNSGKLNTVRGKYGAIKKFDENPVSSRYKPFVVGGASIIDDGTLERFELVASYGNETIFFNNEEINKYNNLRVQRSTQYNTVKDFYLNGGLDKDGSPMDTFEFFNYRECVYPPRIYQYKNYTRQRTTFSFPWRDDRENRSSFALVDNGFRTSVLNSMWPLDAYQTWDTQALDTSPDDERWIDWYGYNAAIAVDSRFLHNQYGILQNIYSFGSSNMVTGYTTGNINLVFKIGPQYNRKHTLSPSSSVVSPNGMNIEGVNSGSTMGNIAAYHNPGGEAKWEAGSQSGLNPFYDTYDNYIQDVRQHGKDYSIIPEFRISEHVETYQTKGLSEEVSNLFSLTGALSNTTDSSKDNFYKIYSTSEFMKHFEVVKKDHKEFVPANSLSLKCKAVKKFLPYEGFYPAQRSVDLATQFYESYRIGISNNSGSDDYGNPFLASQDSSYVQNLMVPTFAPGIFFNTIKSGVAVDYPLINNTCSLANGYISQSAEGDYYLVNPDAVANGLWDRRVPFEAILEPEKHLGGTEIFCNEPHIHANNSGSIFWDGSGDNLYRLMAQNFMAEVPEFFMKSKSFTSISSKPSSDPNIGKTETGKKYIMRIKMYKSQDEPTTPKISGSLLGSFVPPQYPPSSRETFTMYSRPSAFGPPQEVDGASLMSLSSEGSNYSFTPPYYYGQAWCDVLFEPTEAKKYSIQEIISSSSIRQWRYASVTDVIDISKTTFVNGLYTNTLNPDKELAMQLNASVNIFSQTDTVVEQANKGRGIVLPNSSDNPSRWVIQTKFETPMLNFNHLSASTSLTLPQNASQSVPRGMWHQYGNIETDTSKGVFLQVDDVPSDWITNWIGDNFDNYRSLVDLCGFSTEATKLGQIADEKKIYEAVVAVPFIEEEGDRKFFRIPRIDVQRAFGSAADRALVGDSVLKMIVKMQRYVFPPSMDFLKNDTVDPFAMYIFEFSHTLNKQDLANIWQNLYPEIGQTFETAESSISHELLAHELLGGGAIVTPEGTLDVNAVGNEIPDRVRWMVFKVKQRAEINYYKKIIGRQDDLPEATVSSEGANVQVSYNWPYDFFSLVELAKIETEVKFAERAVKSGQEPRSTIVPKTNKKVNPAQETYETVASHDEPRITPKAKLDTTRILKTGLNPLAAGEGTIAGSTPAALGTQTADGNDSGNINEGTGGQGGGGEGLGPGGNNPGGY
jgi:hypothetical protein